MGFNLVFVAALLILLTSIIMGGIRGFLRSSLSLAALLISCVIVSALNPLITGLLRRNTGLDEWVADKVDSAITSELKSGFTEEEDGTITLGQNVTLPADVRLPDGTVLPAGTVIPAGTKLPAGIGLDEFKKQVDHNLSAAQQSKVIEMLPVPESLKNSIEENNNDAIYKLLGVESFTDYIGSFVGNICLNIIGYILTFMIVFFALHILILAFNVVDRLPIVHGINHFAGALLGIFKGFLLLEFLFLLLVPFSATSFGVSVLAQINANGFLRALYHGNFLLKILVGAAGAIV